VSLISDRIDRAIDKAGQTLAFTKLAGAGGTFSVPAIVQPLDSGTMRTYFDDTEVMAIIRPAVRAVCKSASGVIAADTFTLDSKTFVVRKIFKNYSGADVVSITVLASESA